MLQAREDGPRSSFENTDAHARSHEDAFRAQYATGRRVDFENARPARQVLAALDGVPSTSTGSPPSFRTAQGAENYFATEGDNVGGTPSLPPEESSLNNGDSLFYGGRRRPYQPAREQIDRPRGITTGRASRNYQKELRGPPSPKIVCFTCYRVGDHIAPDSDMKVKDVSLVPHQHEKLTTALKGQVPRDAYLRAVALLSYEANRLMNPEAVTDPPPRAGTGTKTLPPIDGDRPSPKH